MRLSPIVGTLFLPYSALRLATSPHNHKIIQRTTPCRRPVWGKDAALVFRSLSFHKGWRFAAQFTVLQLKTAAKRCRSLTLNFYNSLQLSRPPRLSQFSWQQVTADLSSILHLPVFRPSVIGSYSLCAARVRPPESSVSTPHWCTKKNSQTPRVKSLTIDRRLCSCGPRVGMLMTVAGLS